MLSSARRPSLRSLLLAFASLTPAVISTGCAGARPAPGAAHELPFAASASPLTARKLWSIRLTGAITDLAVSRDGSAVLVATAPDRDNDPAANRYRLWRIGSGGRLTWKGESKGQVRSESLTADGALGLVATYDEEITALAPGGAEAWTLEAMCKPIPLRRSRRFLCYHDDDAESDIAFDLYDLEGRKLLSYPVVNDILALKVAGDERHAVIGLTRGQVLLFDPEFRSLWQRKVEGEILDVAVSPGDAPIVAVLHEAAPARGKAPVQRLTVLDSRGRRIAEGSPSRRAGQVELTPSGSAAALYGNGEQGQHVVYFEFPAAGDAVAGGKPAPLVEKWSAGDARAADYSSSLTAAEGLVLLGFDDIAPNSRHSHLIGLGPDGRLRLDIPLDAEEGAYLYSYALARDAGIVVTATDDGVVSAFRISAGTDRSSPD